MAEIGLYSALLNWLIPCLCPLAIALSSSIHSLVISCCSLLSPQLSIILPSFCPHPFLPLFTLADLLAGSSTFLGSLCLRYINADLIVLSESPPQALCTYLAGELPGFWLGNARWLTEFAVSWASWCLYQIENLILGFSGFSSPLRWHFAIHDSMHIAFSDESVYSIFSILGSLSIHA